MKKLILFLLLLLGGGTFAFGAQQIPMHIIDETPPLGGHPYAPARPWYINQNDYILTLPDFEEDYTLQLLNEDEDVVYSVNCLSGTTQVVLPSTLTGDYEIVVIRGETYYGGYIEL